MWLFKNRKALYNKRVAVKIVDVQFGMQVSYKAVEEKGKGPTHNKFYRSFAEVDKSLKPELLKVVFSGVVAEEEVGEVVL